MKRRQRHSQREMCETESSLIDTVGEGREAHMENKHKHLFDS